MSTNPNFGVWRPMAENVEFNALESNSNAVMAVADTVRTTLGPKGLDKLLIDQAMNRHVSNDGVTILLSLKAIHPVARMIVEDRKSTRLNSSHANSSYAV